MFGVESAETQLEALRYIHDSVRSSFNTTLGFIVVASGWLISSSRARNVISTHRRMKTVLLTVIAGGWLLHALRLWMLHTRSANLASTIDADPSVIAAYEVSTADTVGNILVTTLLAGALFTLVLWPPSSNPTDE
jgi:cytochrome c biogenesis protein CcdA